MKKVLNVLLIVMICMVPTIVFAGVIELNFTWWDLYPLLFWFSVMVMLALITLLIIIYFILKYIVKLKESNLKKVKKVFSFIAIVLLIVFIFGLTLLLGWSIEN